MDEDTWLGSDGKIWGTCWSCGGEGVIDGECTCMDDTCCCAWPEPPVCDICLGAGAFPVGQKARP